MPMFDAGAPASVHLPPRLARGRSLVIIIFQPKCDPGPCANDGFQLSGPLRSPSPFLYPAYNVAYIYIYIYIFIYTPKKDRHPRCGEVRRVVPGWLMLLLLLCNLVPAGKADWPAARHVNKITFTILYATWLVVCMAFIGVYMFCRCHVEKSYVGRNN